MTGKEFENKIIEKINELYITNRKKYLIMKEIPDSENDMLTTGQYSSFHDKQDKFRPLNDSHIRSHLRGNQTVGVFSGKYMSKFLCFDLDIKDKTKLKWTYYLLLDALNDLGIKDEYIHAATSGNKGIHVNIFVKDGANLSQLTSLFNMTMLKIKEKLSDEMEFRVHTGSEYYGEFDFGQIEMRPTYSQGVKLELGLNFFNPNLFTNKCNFLDKETLEEVASDYILTIDPIHKDMLMTIMDRINDVDLIKEEQVEDEVVTIKQSIKEPSYMKINKDETETVEYIKNLLLNGLHMEGTRHNSCLKIAKYFRYIGLELDDCVIHLQEWMSNQNKKHYSSTLEFALAECKRISKVVYEKEYSLFGEIENIVIYKNEIDKILEIDNRNDKLLLYSMLIHSKRYALKNGVFYMTYEQMNEMCGISRKGAITSIGRLAESNHIEIVSRNVRSEHGYKSKPNKYKLLVDVELNEIALEINNTSETLNSNELYNKCLISNYTIKELKHLLPDRQYRDISNYNKLAI